jgi:branched-chain amino acid transport system substrate-binding protein
VFRATTPGVDGETPARKHTGVVYGDACRHGEEEMARPAIAASGLSRRGLLAAAAGTLFTAACGSNKNADPGPIRRGSEELVIGASLELTGAAAPFGSLQERALRLTVDRLNEAGVPVGNFRRRIRLVLRDNGSKPQTATQQVTDMIQRDQVHAILGGTNAETSLAIVKVAQTGQVPYLSLASADNITTPLTDRTFVYKLTPDADDVARAMAPIVAGQQARTVGLLAQAGGYGDAGVHAVPNALSNRDLTLVRTERLPATGTSFDAAARAAVKDQPDALIIWAQAPDAGAAAQAVYAAGFRGLLFFDPGAVGDETVTGNSLDAVKGVFTIHPQSLAGSSLTDTTRIDLVRQDFVDSYIQRYGRFSGFAPYAADAVTLIANAARLGRSADRGRIRVYLENQVAEGIAGSYSFAPISHGGMEPDSLGVFTLAQGSWAKFA